MQLFNVRPVDNEFWTLEGEEAHHCTKVLRHKVGDTLDIMDGLGNWVTGLISEVSSKRVVLKLSGYRQREAVPKHRLHLAFSPVKNMSRLEWMIEKAVETGVTDFWIIHLQRTEKTQVRVDRLEKIILSAAKQSLKCWLPVLHPSLKLAEWLPQVKQLPCRMFGSAHTDHHLTAEYNGKDGLFLVGPEGDFTVDEKKSLLQNDFVPVHLGPHRLRTETAVLVGGILMSQYQQKNPTI